MKIWFCQLSWLLKDQFNTVKNIQLMLRELALRQSESRNRVLLFIQNISPFLIGSNPPVNAQDNDTANLEALETRLR